MGRHAGRLFRSAKHLFSLTVGDVELEKKC
jgi:hypothetical protein